MWLVRYRNDPPCQMLVHGRLLTMPLSHDLPHYLHAHHFYDQLLVRLSQFMHTSQASICCVDVGANIGDSIAALALHPSDRFIAVEPNPGFYPYLVKNSAAYQHVLPLQVICSSSDEQRAFNIEEKRGTASIVPANQHQTGLEHATPMTLDSLLLAHGGDSRIDLLKIDTDGHDFEVLAGARSVIQRDLPVVMFECDVFGNALYSEQVLEQLQYFQDCGYQQFMVYDNFGYLLGRYSLSDTGAFQHLLLYQLTSPFLYFDILLMTTPDIDAFYKTEAEVFVGAIANTELQPTARHAIQAMQSV